MAGAAEIPTVENLSREAIRRLREPNMTEEKCPMCEQSLRPIKPMKPLTFRAVVVMWGAISTAYAYLPFFVFGQSGILGLAMLPIVALPAWMFYHRLDEEVRLRESWPRVLARLPGAERDPSTGEKEGG